MRLIIEREGESSIFVQGEWVDGYGHHGRRLTEQLPPEIKVAVAALVAWADGEWEPVERDRLAQYEDARDVEREIEKLQRRVRELRGN